MCVCVCVCVCKTFGLGLVEQTAVENSVVVVGYGHIVYLCLGLNRIYIVEN